MKASELVNFLNDMISNYGDLEIVTQIDDVYEYNKTSFGDVESVSFDDGRINICGKSICISDWVNERNSRYSDNTTNDYYTIPFRKVVGSAATSPDYFPGDHYSVFRKIDAPKESTGYTNYDGREF